MSNKNFANREVCDMILRDYTTKQPFMFLDYANVTTTEITGEQVYAYGGQGHPKRIAFYGEKGGTLTIESQIQTMQLYSLLSGAPIQKGAQHIRRRKVTAGASGIVVPELPVEGSIFVYPATDDCGTPVTGTMSVTSAGSVHTITSSESNLAEGTEYIVYYLYGIDNVETLKITNKVFPKAFEAFGDTIMKTESEEFVNYKFRAYKCAPQQTFSLSFSNTGDPVTVSITCDLLVDDDGNLMDMTLDDTEATTEGSGVTVYGLSVVSVAGSTTGKTKVYVNPTGGSAYRYKIANTADAIGLPNRGDAASDWGDGSFTAGTDITAATGKYIGVVELDGSNKAIAGGVQVVTAATE